LARVSLSRRLLKLTLAFYRAPTSEFSKMNFLTPESARALLESIRQHE
jgi:hypothetical protein